MRNEVIVVGLAALTLCLGGCVFVVGGHGHDRRRDSEDVTIAEIDAVGRLSFDSERKAGYERIAGREELSSEAQVYLVRAVLRKLSFDNAKEDVLLALIANPSFCSAAKREILESIDKLAFGSSKKNILKAISEARSTKSETNSKSQ